MGDAEINKGPKLGVRHMQAFFLFSCISCNYVGRLSIGVAVVAITNSSTANPDFEEYNWKEREKSYVFSSFFWGYVITQIPGGLLARRFGVYKILFLSTFMTSITSALIPTCIYVGGWQLLCLTRWIQGIFQGCIFPCTHQHLSKWSPPKERNRLGGIAYAGGDFGIVIAMLIGIVAQTRLGWPGIYYISAFVCALWCVLWLIYGANSAFKSRHISKEEAQYIETSLMELQTAMNKRIPIPWIAIFTSVPFIAIIIMRIGQGWLVSITWMQVPSYMHGVMKLNIKENAIVSALPFVAMFCTSFISIIIADFIMSRQLLSLAMLRRIFNSFAFWVPAAAFLGLGFLNEGQAVPAVLLMIVMVAGNAPSTIGSLLNMIDLSPNHAGILMCIVNFISCAGPVGVPILIGYIVRDTSNQSQWQILFTISAVVLSLCNIVFIILMTVEQQPWDDPYYLENKKVERANSAIIR